MEGTGFFRYVEFMAKLLNQSIEAALAQTPGWKQEAETIVRTFKFADFPAAVSFVTALVSPAEQANHHPDIDIRYNTVKLTLTTHDQRGLTDLDFELARKINQIADQA